VTHQPRVELEKLLISLLTEADVRRIVRLLPGGEKMHAELPGTGVSLTALVHQAVSVLERHGRLDGAFFEILVAERPSRRDEIQALAARMLEITGVTRRVLTVHAPMPAPAMVVLGHELADALARKQRLEAAGQPVGRALDEIRRLKRELRRGGILRPGDVLGQHYLLVEHVGQGGFATVWRARDPHTKDDVAIKVMHPNMAGDPERRQRFFRGARMMVELAHPAVVGIRQQEGEDDGFHYFVMDFLAGGNLHDAVLARRWTQEQTQSLILQVGAALAAAHERGIVHRDIKPSNILLDHEGRPHLTDFDLVTAPDTTGGTRTGALGTFLYAPPEMLERPQEATARADVYGLGMTMAFMLHGAPLPRISTHYASRFVRSLACPTPFHAVLARAIAWEPEQRFADAKELCQALHEAIREASASASGSETSTSNTRSKTSTSNASRFKLPPGVSTLREFVDAIQNGLPIRGPILVSVGMDIKKINKQELSISEVYSRSTAEPEPRLVAGDTLNQGEPPSWVERLFGEYASSEVLLLGHPTPLTIGRGRECDIHIGHDSVSKVHASVLFDENSLEYYLVDEDSRNGTYINGNSLIPQVRTAIWSGVYVSFGYVVFAFIRPATLHKLVCLRRPSF
jgi:serine/threonine protein kinase